MRQSMSDIDQFCSSEYAHRIRSAVKTALDQIGIDEGYIKDRLLVDLVREIALSTM
jgi:hypothetical protein